MTGSVTSRIMIRKIIKSPFGEMELISDGKQLTYVNFIYDPDDEHGEVPLGSDEILNETEKQLDEYFQGTRRNFNLPLKKFGTEFQRAVFKVLSSITYGEYLTYKEIAERAGSPKGFRAAGAACKANKYSIIVPCHRVLSTSGKLTGYSGDKTFMKDNLLKFEAEYKK